MLEKIKEIIAESLGTDISTLTEETSFKEDLGADSLDLFEMVMALEEAFDVEIPSEDLESIKTIKDVKEYIGKAAVRGDERHENRNHSASWNGISHYPGWNGLGGRTSSGCGGI